MHHKSIENIEIKNVTTPLKEIKKLSLYHYEESTDKKISGKKIQIISKEETPCYLTQNSNIHFIDLSSHF